eukprot:m.94930 g.94930  ORF g.94930 m.94930 type:complete len:177 (+) comp13468_c0_seq3:291-821(+)
MKGFVFEGEDIVEKKEEGHVVPKHGSGKKKDNLVQKQNSEDETEGKDVSALIIGLAPDQFDYGKLTSCFKLVKENNATLIALNKARYIMTETNGLCLGAGHDSFCYCLVTQMLICTTCLGLCCKKKYCRLVCFSTGICMWCGRGREGQKKVCSGILKTRNSEIILQNFLLLQPIYI